MQLTEVTARTALLVRQATARSPNVSIHNTPIQTQVDTKVNFNAVSTSPPMSFPSHTETVRRTSRITT
jgi:hypothetical protein